MNRLMEMLPSYYRGIREFEALTETETAELDQLQTGVLVVEDDQFIFSSTEVAVARRERMFGILADPSTETLDLRKKRLLSRMQSNPPYTIRYLKTLLDTLVGEDRHEIMLDRALKEIEVLIDVDSAPLRKEVNRLLERVLPLNLDVSTAIRIMKERLVLKVRPYDFEVSFPITNLFHTAEVHGGIVRIPSKLEERTYSFEVFYPITNVLVPAGNNLNVNDKVGLEVHTAVYYTKYNQSGEIIAGEASL